MDKRYGLIDSAGEEVKSGDLIWDESGNWHVAFDGNEGLEIRDLNNNNLYMYDLQKFYTKGHFSNHLDKLTNEDLRDYFDTNLRWELLKKYLKTECFISVTKQEILDKMETIEQQTKFQG